MDRHVYTHVICQVSIPLNVPFPLCTVVSHSPIAFEGQFLVQTVKSQVSVLHLLHHRIPFAAFSKGAVKSSHSLVLCDVLLMF